jgi:molybdopterin molybdotransferase
MGVIGGVPLIGLPGNPAAVFITFAQIARAVIAALAGETWRAPGALPVFADFAYAKKEGRREYVRASLAFEEGRPLARKYEREGAGVVTSLTRTDGLVELAEDTTRVAPGDRVGFIPWALLA